MKFIPVWLYYTVLRLVFFAVPLTVLLLVPLPVSWTAHWLIAVIAAAVIGLCLSYLLLRKPREALSKDLYELRHRETEPPRIDDEIEDAIVDASGAAADYTPSAGDSMAGREPKAWRDATPAERPQSSDAERNT